ncbi:MAG: hypothetical protein RI575_02905 [Balneolaceae bacterium]|nr:hypothetical protein [Balneolaceae bacterium]MDR9408686.1 hypothetical protein [Balneolaceae bacterium]
MMNTIEIVCIFLAFILGALVLRFIFSKEFRADLLRGDARASFWEKITFEGATFLVLCGILVWEIIYTGKEATSQLRPLNDFIASLQLGFIDPDIVRKEIFKIKEKNQKLNRILEDLPSYLEELNFESTVSEDIRDIASEGRGPWSPPQSIEIKVSIPGSVEDDSTAIGCPDFYQNEYKLYSRPDLYEEIEVANEIFVEVKERITIEDDCSTKMGVDLQINCDDAYNLLTDRILTCTDGGEARYPRGISERYFNVSAIPVIE